MVTLLGVDGLCLRWTFRPLSGADVGESQRTASPEDQKVGARGWSPTPTSGRGESLGARDPNGRPNSGARVRKLAFPGGLHPAEGTLGVGQQDDLNPSRQWGKGRANRAGVAGDRETVRCRDQTLESQGFFPVFTVG